MRQSLPMKAYSTMPLIRRRATKQEKKKFIYSENIIHLSKGEYGLNDGENITIEWKENSLIIFTVTETQNQIKKTITGEKKGSVLMTADFLKRLVDHYHEKKEIQSFLNRG